jgi:rhamnose utilization protein RhaD (predicted bifunctional aldolase and dehydrogenase)
MEDDRIEELVALSRRYGSDPDWVLAGGGNTSFKDAKTLFVKASGVALASIDASGFCAVDRGRLDAIWSRTYPEAADAREAAALADLMAARIAGETKRPSVETLLHGFFPEAFVVHTHPALVNGMTCGRAGEEVFRALFSREAVWVPCVDPGYTLAREVRSRVEAFRSREGHSPALVFLQNHGLLVAAGYPAKIVELSEGVVARLAARIKRRPEKGRLAVPASALAGAMGRIAALAESGSFLVHHADADLLGFAESPGAFAPLSGSFSPDHIVYAGHEILRVGDPEALDAAWRDYAGRNGAKPRIVLVAGLGAVAVGRSRAAAETAMALFLDAASVAVYAESFGGALHMSAEKVQFIRNWEVERYRASASLGDARPDADRGGGK